MLRNREIKNYLLSSILIMLILSGIGFYLSIEAGIIALISGAVLIAYSLIFTHRRYKKLHQLITYIERICSGEYGLDVRDNDEGELSILKNEIHKVTRILREQSQMLEQDKILMARSMSNISHQIKTPLTAMMMANDFLQDDSLPPEKRREFSAEMRAQLERLEWLISSLLKLSKLDSGTVEFNTEEVSVRSLIDNAMKPILIPMEVRCQTAEINVPDNIFIKCDKSWTVESFLNIIKNCMEHTPDGGKIKITAEDSPILTAVKIQDSGSGIDEKDLPHIFERFYRGRNARKDSVGIGLAMANEIICAQNGNITAKNTPDGGLFIIQMFKQSK